MLVFKLTVTDDEGSSDSAITAVKVVRNEEVPAVSSSNVPDSSTSNLQIALIGLRVWVTQL